MGDLVSLHLCSAGGSKKAHERSKEQASNEKYLNGTSLDSFAGVIVIVKTIHSTLYV